MSAPRHPTGRRAREGHDRVVFERTFRAPIADVWAAVTEPRRLERWVGTWDGDPADGWVGFRMTAEAEDASAERMVIDECDPPRRLAVTTHAETGSWRLLLALTDIEGGTRLTFTQPGIDPVEAESVGPGWEYYLDRLVAAETGGDVTAIDFDRDYYPSMLDQYREQLG